MCRLVRDLRTVHLCATMLNGPEMVPNNHMEGFPPTITTIFARTTHREDRDTIYQESYNI